MKTQITDKPLSRTLQTALTFALGVSLLGFSPAVFAQALSESEPEANEEVITLEEFQVTSASIKNEYIATEATAGTRLAEKINDLPYSIQVITDDFIQDFQLTDTEEIFRFIGGASADPDGGSLSDAGSFAGRVRGFVPLTTRDGFQFAMPSTPANTLQSEFIKGPMSTLYGRAQPGGFFNRVTNRPGAKAQYTATATYGNEGYRRAALTGTGSVAKNSFNNKLFYRAYLDWTRSEGYFGEVDHEKADRYFAGVSFLYKFRKQTSLYLTAEYQPQRTVQAGTPSGYVFADASGKAAKAHRGWKGIGRYDIWYGDNTYRDADFYGLNLLFEHRINNIWSHRASLQTYNKDTKKLRWVGASLLYLDDVTFSGSSENHGFHSANTFSNRDPYQQDQEDECIALQAELLGVIRRPKVEHKFLFAVDLSLREQNNREYRWNTESGYLPYQRTLSFLDPYYKYRIDSNLDHYRATSDYDLETDTFGAFASYRASLFRSRLALMASLRFDYYEDKLHNHLTSFYENNDPYDPTATPLPEPLANIGKSDGDKLTYSVGANYKIFGDKFLVYTSSSSSYRPQSTVDNGLNKLVKPQEAASIEFGFKGSSPGNKFGYTLSFYTMELENVAVANDDYYSNLHAGSGTVPQYNSAGKQKSKGFDGAISLNLIPDLTIIGSFGYCDNEVTNVQEGENANFALGKPAAGVAKWNAALAASYSIKNGRLRGLKLGLSGTWQDSTTGYYETHGSSSSTIYYYGLKIPSVFLLNGFASYEFKTGKKLRHRIQMNVKNILDNEYHARNGRASYGTTCRLTYKLIY